MPCEWYEKDGVVMHINRGRPRGPKRHCKFCRSDYYGGKLCDFPVENTDKEALQGAVLDNVEIGSQVMTDEASGYQGMDGLFYSHATVNHGAGEYSRGGVHTNGIESVWALLKRGVYGTWHHVSAKHVARYVNEVTFRLNAGNVANHTLDRLDSFISAVDGQRLTYKRLTA